MHAYGYKYHPQCTTPPPYEKVVGSNGVEIRSDSLPQAPLSDDGIRESSGVICEIKIYVAGPKFAVRKPQQAIRKATQIQQVLIMKN